MTNDAPYDHTSAAQVNDEWITTPPKCHCAEEWDRHELFVATLSPCIEHTPRPMNCEQGVFVV